MQCLQCQHENAADARFCNQCATPFAPWCATCGGEHASGAKFCHQCGTPLLTGPSAPRVLSSLGNERLQGNTGSRH